MDQPLTVGAKASEQLSCDLGLHIYFNCRLCQIAREVQNQIQELRPNLSGTNNNVEKNIPATRRMGVKSLFNEDIQGGLPLSPSLEENGNADG
jgi:galactose mutarotase-like enzyme